MPNSLKISRRNAPEKVVPAPKPAPRPRRRLDSLVLPFPRPTLLVQQPALLDRFGRPLRAVAKPWIWVPRPTLMPFPGVMPQMPPHDVAVAVAIAYVTGNNVTSSSITPPASTAGNLILTCAMRAANTTPPTLASGYTSLLTDSTNNNSYIIGWKYHSGSESSTTWTNANYITNLIYSGVNQTNPIGDYDTTSTNLTTWPIPAKTLLGVNSWVVAFGYANSENLGTPSGMTQRQTAGIGQTRRSYDTNGVVASFAAKTGSLAVQDRAIGASIEILVG